MNSFGDDFFDGYGSLPPLMDPPSSSKPGSSFTDGGHNEFKSINTAPVSRSSDGNYHSYIPTTITNNHNFLHPPQTSNFHPQIQLQNQLLSYHTTPNPIYLHQGRSTTGAVGFGGNDQAILRALAGNNNETSTHENQCKVEQFSSNNQSMISRSQDTGLSTDMNTTEISSVLSKQDIVSGNRSYEDLDGPFNAELDTFWDNY